MNANVISNVFIVNCQGLLVLPILDECPHHDFDYFVISDRHRSGNGLESAGDIVNRGMMGILFHQCDIEIDILLENV